MEDVQYRNNANISKFIKTNNITEDYNISSTVLGLGINGKVVQCYRKQTGELYALKVSNIKLLLISLFEELLHYHYEIGY